jgi:ABC-type nitrate/sulfonate/bicarbonate transport system substrate-binding protein
MGYCMRWLLGGLILAALACGPRAAAPAANDPAAPAPATAPGAVGSTDTAAASAPSAPPALRRVEMPLAAVSAQDAPLWLGVDQGYFARHGLDLEIIDMAPATASQALSAGSAPIGMTGGSGVTAWLGGAKNLVFVGGLINRALFKVVVRPEIMRFEDLRGRTVGGTTAGSAATIAMQETLRQRGLDPERDVSMVYMRENPSLFTGLQSGAVYGAAMGSPWPERVEAFGGRVLLDLKKEGLELITLNVTSTRQQLASDPDVVRRFLMGYVEAMQAARDNPDQAIAAILRGTKGDDRAEAAESYEVYRDVWNPWPSATAIGNLMRNIDLPEARTADPAALIDDSILRELEASGWLAAHYRP